MGYTHEAVPYVGELNERPGQYIIAGHSGHGKRLFLACQAWSNHLLKGMARIMTCARGIAKLLKGEDYASTGLPECFQPTKERMTRYDFTVQKQWMVGLPFE